MAFEDHRPRLKGLLTPSGPELASSKAAMLQKLTEDEVADGRELRTAVFAAQGVPQVDDRQRLNLQPDDQARYLKWEVAWRLGLASLQARGTVFPLQTLASSPTLHVSITEGNHSGSIRFDEYDILLSQRYRIAPESVGSTGFALHDPDLFLQRISAVGMHLRVATALREAVECYRAELLVAACVLLGSASEGAWIELATTIAASGAVLMPAALKRELDGDAPKAEIVQSRTFDLVPSLCKDHLKAANLTMARWNGMNQIAQLLRSLRNYSIHFGGDALEKVDYGSVGVLFLNGSEYFNDLYRLRQAF